MSYIGKKPVDFNDVAEAQTFTVTGDLTGDTIRRLLTTTDKSGIDTDTCIYRCGCNF